jgi:hypothetical protein
MMPSDCANLSLKGSRDCPVVCPGGTPLPCSAAFGGCTGAHRTVACDDGIGAGCGLAGGACANTGAAENRRSAIAVCVLIS